ncbi:MAG: M48 family metallopeptidase [Bacteroidales bacterium]|jgi:predicted metal-dependent hydrolase|nr:M48 family metallopeptidase [Bacteroidales bacterium]MCI1785334.1 M48 family metallopeptidase [Bacteroidales bacterium]
MKDKLYRDGILGDVVLKTNPRSRRISIRIHPEKGVTVNIPAGISCGKGFDFFLSERGKIAEVMARQKNITESARKAGKAVSPPSDGVVVRTLLSEITFVLESVDAEATPGISGRDVFVAEDLSSTGRDFLNTERPVTRKFIRYRSRSYGGDEADSGFLMRELVRVIRTEADFLLPAKLEFFARKYDFVFDSVSVKHNSSNWGSCSGKRNINLNLNIMRLPEPLCDYVVLHELCHLRYHDHGPCFHRFLDMLCDDNMKRLSNAGDPYALNLAEKIAAGASTSGNVMRREISGYRLI